MIKRYHVMRIGLLGLLAAGFVLVGLLSAALLYGNSVTTMTSAETQKLPIIMYHHLSEQAEKLGDYTISPKQLEADLKTIKQRGYTAITLEQLLGYYDGEYDLPEKSVLLTFDDGYYSVYTYAYPLLKKYDMPAVCFILGQYTQLYSDGEMQNVNYAHMTWEQLREMQDSGLLEIGSHTYDLHHAKGEGERYGITMNSGEQEDVYRQAIAADLKRLSTAMEKELSVCPDTFAYPFGAISKQSYSVLRELGFRIAFTCEEKVNLLSCKPEKEMLILLGRYNRASRYSTDEFLDRMGISG